MPPVWLDLTSNHTCCRTDFNPFCDVRQASKPVAQSTDNHDVEIVRVAVLKR
jgi:hypothetical protein